MEAAKLVRVHRKVTASREYDAITVCIGDLHLSCDAFDRQIQLARLLADSHECPFQVSPELSVRVDKALKSQRESLRDL